MHPEPKQVELFTFDLEYMRALAECHHDTYRANMPFPHIIIDNFLPTSVAEKLLDQFPPPNSIAFMDRSSKNQPGKFGTANGEHIAKAPPFIQHVLAMMNSYVVLEFLTLLSGIEKLIPDPNFSGGGLHQIVRGGKLNIHADFNFESRLGLYRRLNVLLYLNKDWKDSYEGFLELWDQTLSKCQQKIAPLFNRCVIFDTTSESYHGHPTPLAAPEHMTRKSLALYYYTKEPSSGAGGKHGTLWQNMQAHE
jgi:hypothetical protein